MQRKENDWCKGLEPPTSTTLKDGVGYLDRLIGGGRGYQKQYLRPSEKNKPAKANPNHKKNNKQPIVKLRSPVVALDDEKWLEERRKKFPKLSNGDSRSKETAEVQTTPLSYPVKPTVDDTHIQTSIHKGSSAKNDNNNKNINSKQKQPQRKKTLFEKLMDSD